MTVLSAAQSAMIRLVGRKPSALFSSNEQTVLEIADLINEVAIDIMKGHEWQALTKVATITGDGTTAAFDLPSDYDRMCIAQPVQDGTSWFWNYSPSASVSDFTRLQDGAWSSLTPGWWIIMGGQFQFYPAPTDGAEAKFAYISRNFAKSPPASGTGLVSYRDSFTDDQDTFLLDERLLTLGVVYRYREQKGMGYGEDMKNYEIALSQEQARDGGSRVIRTSGARWPNAVTAWPWELGAE